MQTVASCRASHLSALKAKKPAWRGLLPRSLPQTTNPSMGNFAASMGSQAATGAGSTRQQLGSCWSMVNRKKLCSIQRAPVCTDMPVYTCSNGHASCLCSKCEVLYSLLESYQGRRRALWQALGLR